MRREAIVVPVVLAVLVAGCVNYDERIELNTDGSGIVRMHLAVSEQMLPPDFRTKVEKESDLLPMPREELIADIEKEGFKVRSLRAQSSGGLRHFYLVLEFRNLETLVKSELFGGRRASLKRDGGKWRFSQEIEVSEETLTDRASPKVRRKDDKPSSGDKSGEERGRKASALKQLEKRFGKARVRRMLSGYSLSFSLQLTDATLIHTNGRNHRDTVAIWEVALDQLIEKKPTLRMSAEFAIAEPSPARARPEEGGR